MLAKELQIATKVLQDYYKITTGLLQNYYRITTKLLRKTRLHQRHLTARADDTGPQVSPADGDIPRTGRLHSGPGSQTFGARLRTSRPDSPTNSSRRPGAGTRVLVSGGANGPPGTMQLAPRGAPLAHNTPPDQLDPGGRKSTRWNKICKHK